MIKSIIINLSAVTCLCASEPVLDEKENDEAACRKRLYKCKRMDPTFQTLNNELSEHVDLDSLPGIGASRETGTSE